MDPALEESSRGLGHNAWSTFFRVIIRQLRPSIAAGGLLAALYTLSDFGAVSILRYETFTFNKTQHLLAANARESRHGQVLSDRVHELLVADG